jgi:hypothetical protein
MIHEMPLSLRLGGVPDADSFRALDNLLEFPPTDAEGSSNAVHSQISSYADSWSSVETDKIMSLLAYPFRSSCLSQETGSSSTSVGGMVYFKVQYLMGNSQVSRADSYYEQKKIAQKSHFVKANQ